MQVNLFPVADPALVRHRVAGMLLSAPDSSPLPPPRGETHELRERVRRDEERHARAVATLVPTRPADVINDAERNVEHSSRAFRRQVAREGAAAQFQQDRQAFREALSAAKGKGAPAAPRESADVGAQAGTRAQAKPNVGPHPATAGKPPPEAGGGRAQTLAAPDSRRALTGPPPDTVSPPVLPSAGTGAAPDAGRGAAINAVLARMGRRAVQNSTGPGRLASSTAVQASKAAAPRGGRAGGTAPAAAAGTRSPAKSGPGATGKTSGTRPAQNADWDANIERLVRIVRSRISGERSHTVLRLDPPELGSLRLQMDLRGEMLTLRVDTSTDLAHRLLWEDLNRLRHGLEASGIRLERVEVRPPTQAPEASEHDVSRHADTQEETQGGSAQTDAEHPEERGTDSHPAGSTEGARRGTDSEPAAESLVNVVA